MFIPRFQLNPVDKIKWHYQLYHHSVRFTSTSIGVLRLAMSERDRINSLVLRSNKNVKDGTLRTSKWTPFTCTISCKHVHRNSLLFEENPATHTHIYKKPASFTMESFFVASEQMPHMRVRRLASARIRAHAACGMGKPYKLHTNMNCILFRHFNFLDRIVKCAPPRIDSRWSVWSGNLRFHSTVTVFAFSMSKVTR